MSFSNFFFPSDLGSLEAFHKESLDWTNIRLKKLPQFLLSLKDLKDSEFKDGSNENQRPDDPATMVRKSGPQENIGSRGSD